MKFDKNRFAKLAGLPQSRGTLNESRRRKAMRRRAMLNEGLYGGSRRSEVDMFDALDLEDEDIVRYDDDFGRQDMRRLDRYPEYDLEMDDMGPENYERMSRFEMEDEDYSSRRLREGSHNHDAKDEMMQHEMDSMEEMYEMDHMGEMKYEADMEEEGMDHMMYEEEEDDKKEEMVEIDDAELMKEVKNIKRKRINEARLKAVIEDELREVLAEMQYGSDWMYGDSKPQNSKSGQVTRGFKGLGFK